MPAAGVQLVFDAQFSKPISRLAVAHLNTIIQDADCTVPYSCQGHRKGEVCHYFGRIWVVTGEGLQHVVCYQKKDTSTFIILQYTRDSHMSHQVYESLLDFMEERWYFLKAELHA